MKLSPRFTQPGAILLLCFLAEGFHRILFLLMGSALYTLIGFEGYRVTYIGLLGCVPEMWMGPVVNSTFMLYQLVLLAAGYIVTRKANTLWMYCLGAVLFYPFIGGIVQGITWDIVQHRIPFVWSLNAEKLSAIPLPLFGDYYRYKVTLAIVSYALLVVYLYWAYRIVFHYWPPVFRKQVFLLGSVSCGLGWVMWYLVVGPLCLPF